MLSIILLALLTAQQPTPDVDPPKKFVITPQAVPSPALRYTLLPPLRDMKTGNAVPQYYRCMSPDGLHWISNGKFAGSISAWLQLPYEQAARKGLPHSSQQKPKEGEEDLPIPATIEEVKMINLHTFANEIDVAARRTHAEWEYLEQIKTDNMMLLVPEVQSIRRLAEIVQARARLAIMDHHFDRAVFHLQSGLAMAQHLNEARLLVASLTGLGIARNMMKTTTEFIQQPNAPNLYWALSQLPQPFIEFRNAHEGDRLGVEHYFGDPKELEGRIWSQAEIQDLIEMRIRRILSTMSSVDSMPNLTLLILKEYPAAKAWLAQQGRSVEEIERMTATQAVLLHARARHRSMADDYFKLLVLPIKERLAQAEAFTIKIRQLKDNHDMAYYIGFNFYTYLPNVWWAQLDADREIALLRCVELLRHHAAVAGKKLPAAWEEVKDLPIPVDPYTTKPFQYELKGDHALITMEPVPSLPQGKRLKQYEVFLK
jgi:hypothetical protein